MRKNFASVSTFLVREGQKVKIEAPPRTVWSLLFAHRVRGGGVGGRTVLAAWALEKGGKLGEKIELLEFKPGQQESLAPGIDLQSTSPVVCTVEGGGVLRLFFASEARARLRVERDGEGKAVAFDFEPRLRRDMARIAKSRRSLGLMALDLELLMPGDFLQYPTMEKFDERVMDFVAQEVARMSEAELMSELLELIGFIDMRLSLGDRVVDGDAVLLVSTLNTNPEMVDVVLAICLQKRNYLVFVALLVFLDDKAKVASVLQSPLPRTKVVDFEPLHVIFGVVAERKMKVHFHLLNLFHKISPREELQIVFNASNIYGIGNDNDNAPPDEEPEQPSLDVGGEVTWEETIPEEEEEEEECEEKQDEKPNRALDVGASISMVLTTIVVVALFVKKYTVDFF